MPTYRHGSNPLVHAAGLIEWPVSAYTFPRDRAVIQRVITETWSGLPKVLAVRLLSRDLSYRLDDDTVVLHIPENNVTARPAEAVARTPSHSTGEVGQ